MTDGESENLRIVTGFCAAWSTRDLQQILPFLSGDCVYRMTETMEPVSGHAGVVERLGPWIESSQAIEFRILESFVRGPIVTNHRVDTFSSSTRPLTWEGVGVFLVSDGLIKEWFDYTMRVERG